MKENLVARKERSDELILLGLAASYVECEAPPWLLWRSRLQPALEQPSGREALERSNPGLSWAVQRYNKCF